MTFLVDYLGCKVNSYEINGSIKQLLEAGYTFFDKTKDSYPNVILINTCAVTETSLSKDRKLIRRYKKDFPKAIIVVMGCYSQYQSKFISENLEVDIVLGTSKRFDIVKLLEEFNNNKKKIIFNENIFNVKKFEDNPIKKDYFHTRAYVKIQDGCNNFCSYCLIPFVRGQSRSRKKESILKEIEDLRLSGHKEIILTGIDLGSYGLDLYKDYKFSNLLEDILKNNKDLFRLRISSIEESQIDDLFLELYKKYDNLASHLHIPLQSGSQTILEKMNRKYSLENYRNILKKIREIRKDISITTDLIVGFPGETQELFLETYNFCKEMNFSKIHCFPYSKRFGTLAAKMEQIPLEIKKERVKKILELSKNMENDYYKKFIGKQMEVLFEQYDKENNIYKGHTSNYLEVSITSNIDLIGKVLPINLTM